MGETAVTSRSGSKISSKQMARAAVEGCRLTFRFSNSALDVSGYLVGMDDYHWLVVAVAQGQDKVDMVLVHKGLAPVVYIGRPDSLTDEGEAVRAEVKRILPSFEDWAVKAKLIRPVKQQA